MYFIFTYLPLYAGGGFFSISGSNTSLRVLVLILFDLFLYSSFSLSFLIDAMCKMDDLFGNNVALVFVSQCWIIIVGQMNGHNTFLSCMMHIRTKREEVTPFFCRYPSSSSSISLITNRSEGFDSNWIVMRTREMIFGVLALRTSGKSHCYVQIYTYVPLIWLKFTVQF